MKTLQTGKKQSLLMYRRTVDRLFFATLLLGLLLMAVWFFPLLGGVGFISQGTQSIISVSAVVVLTLSMFSYLARFRAYVQVKQSHLSVVTPLIHLNISFQRLRSAHPALIQQLFPARESSWARRSFLRPFYGKTAIVVELKGYPLNPALLRLFFTKEMFFPQNKGFVILIPDWMKFSTELDSMHGKWLGGQNSRQAPE
ncbi:MAG: hypothetical protein A2Z16_08790 [Chloroflexi bacterium RBG_16_54_18]|nr:MAG: hypothetical protein A2Z16_08790 [Chloroflexi bacterium RBG_16_54_18]